MRFKVGQVLKYRHSIAKVVAICDRPPNDHYCLVECECGFSPPDEDEMWYRDEGQWVTSGSIHNLNKSKRYFWIWTDDVQPGDFINGMLMETE